MISSIHTIFNNKKIIDYIEEEDESVSLEDIAKVDLEIIQELEELYDDYEEEEDNDNDNDSIYEEKEE
ncbi:MAG TPA: hypothetical protein VFC05_06750, partial [Nitrososphaeraceae archaeon]|nr:hypothetical protein [Nitrososphaeraceae archaeon]